MNRFFLSLSILVWLLSPLNSFASYDPVPWAIQDGIGYRSNLLDTANPYSVTSRRMLGTLLERYDLLPSWTDYSSIPYHNVPGEHLNNETYNQTVLSLITDPRQAESFVPVPDYRYGFGNCRTNTFQTALDFIHTLTSLQDRQAADLLLQTRHYLLLICDNPESKRPLSQTKIETALSGLGNHIEAKPWANYLMGAAAFYTNRLSQSEDYFSRIPDTALPWLAQTARYMTVRIAKVRADKFRYMLRDDLDSKQGLKAFSLFDSAVVLYLKRYPNSQYTQEVSNLKRYLFKIRDDDLGLHQEYQANFKNFFQINSQVLAQQRLKLFDEMQLFFYAEQPPSTHPLLLVQELLMRRKFIKNNVTVRPIAKIKFNLFSKANGLHQYPGLKAFADLLILDGLGRYEEIVAEKITQKLFGPLWPDALGLQARAFSHLKQHQKSAKAWLDLDSKYPVFNALTEVANQYVKANQFAKFALLADQQPKRTFKKDDDYYRDEFEKGPLDFKSTFQPFTKLLQRGFDNFVAEIDVQKLIKDPNISDDIKFISAEPFLRRHLLNEDFKGYLSLFKSLNSKTNLFKGYKDITPSIKRLSQNKMDADALVNLGFFLYKNHLFFACIANDVTLWEKTLGKCHYGNARELQGTAPIKMFTRALNIYKAAPMRSLGEARVLRIIIYCYQSYANQNYCLRQHEKDYSKSDRKSLFNRLHKYFPEKAKQTPYWY